MRIHDCGDENNKIGKIEMMVNAVSFFIIECSLIYLQKGFSPSADGPPIKRSV